MDFVGARRWTRGTRFALILGLSVASIVALCLTPRVPLGAGYHNFADKRLLLGIPNCMDVLSNIPFLAVGVWGGVWLLFGRSDGAFINASERIPYIVFFAGVALTGVGSYRYHLQPGDGRLPWDLLPMTISFVSMVVAVINERIGTRPGFWLYLPLLALGSASVAYWYFTEAQGRGDYRFYLYVQFFSPVLLAAILWLFPAKYTGTNYLIAAFCLFVLAKIAEVFDEQIFSATGFVSGHTLKHLTAGAACYWVLRMLQQRRPIGSRVQAGFAKPAPVYAADRLHP